MDFLISAAALMLIDETVFEGKLIKSTISSLKKKLNKRINKASFKNKQKSNYMSFNDAYNNFKNNNDSMSFKSEDLPGGVFNTNKAPSGLFGSNNVSGGLFSLDNTSGSFFSSNNVFGSGSSFSDDFSSFLNSDTFNSKYINPFSSDTTDLRRSSYSMGYEYSKEARRKREWDFIKSDFNSDISYEYDIETSNIKKIYDMDKSSDKTSTMRNYVHGLRNEFDSYLSLSNMSESDLCYKLGKAIKDIDWLIKQYDKDIINEYDLVNFKNDLIRKLNALNVSIDSFNTLFIKNVFSIQTCINNILFVYAKNEVVSKLIEYGKSILSYEEDISNDRLIKYLRDYKRSIDTLKFLNSIDSEEYDELSTFIDKDIDTKIKSLIVSDIQNMDNKDKTV